jgi:hypothetical protein
MTQPQDPVTGSQSYSEVGSASLSIPTGLRVPS